MISSSFIATGYKEQLIQLLTCFRGNNGRRVSKSNRCCTVVVQG